MKLSNRNSYNSKKRLHVKSICIFVSKGDRAEICFLGSKHPEAIKLGRDRVPDTLASAECRGNGGAQRTLALSGALHMLT